MNFVAFLVVGLVLLIATYVSVGGYWFRPPYTMQSFREAQLVAFICMFIEGIIGGFIAGRYF